MTAARGSRILGRSSLLRGQTWRRDATVVSMQATDARLVARLHVDLGHVSSAVCMAG
jgi:hypothetical protein